MSVIRNVVNRFNQQLLTGLKPWEAFLMLSEDPTAIKWEVVSKAFATDALFEADFWLDGWQMRAEVCVGARPANAHLSPHPGFSGSGAVIVKDRSGFSWFVPDFSGQDKIAEMVTNGVDPEKATALVQQWIEEDAAAALSYGTDWMVYSLRVFATRGGRRIGSAVLDGIRGEVLPLPEDEFGRMAGVMARDAIRDALKHLNQQAADVANWRRQLAS